MDALPRAPMPLELPPFPGDKPTLETPPRPVTDVVDPSAEETPRPDVLVDPIGWRESHRAVRKLGKLLSKETLNNVDEDGEATLNPHHLVGTDRRMAVRRFKNLVTRVNDAHENGDQRTLSRITEPLDPTRYESRLRGARTSETETNELKDRAMGIFLHGLRDDFTFFSNSVQAEAARRGYVGAIDREKLISGFLSRISPDRYADALAVLEGDVDFDDKDFKEHDLPRLLRLDDDKFAKSIPRPTRGLEDVHTRDKRVYDRTLGHPVATEKKPKEEKRIVYEPVDETLASDRYRKSELDIPKLTELRKEVENAIEKQLAAMRSEGGLGTFRDSGARMRLEIKALNGAMARYFGVPESQLSKVPNDVQRKIWDVLKMPDKLFAHLGSDGKVAPRSDSPRGDRSDRPDRPDRGPRRDDDRRDPAPRPPREELRRNPRPVSDPTTPEPETEPVGEPAPLGVETVIDTPVVVTEPGTESSATSEPVVEPIVTETAPAAAEPEIKIVTTADAKPKVEAPETLEGKEAERYYLNLGRVRGLRTEIERQVARKVEQAKQEAREQKRGVDSLQVRRQAEAEASIRLMARHFGVDDISEVPTELTDKLQDLLDVSWDDYNKLGGGPKGNTTTKPITSPAPAARAPQPRRAADPRQTPSGPPRRRSGGTRVDPSITQQYGSWRDEIPGN